MEASEEILLNSLASSGVPIPLGCSSVGDLTPPSLFSLCSAALRLIDGLHHYASAFPPYLPEDSMPDRVKICTELAHAFNKLGYNPELSFHKFLYPSEEDLYNLVRFLVGKLSESTGARTPALRDGYNRKCDAEEELRDEGEALQNEKILDGLKDLRLQDSSGMISQDDLAQRGDEPNSALHDVGIGTEESNPGACSKGGEYESSRSIEQNSYQNQGEVLKKLTVANMQHLDEELQLLKAAAEMVFDGQHPVEFYIEQLNDQVEAKRHKLKELESEWIAIERPLQEKKRNLEESLFSLYPEASGKLVTMKMETESVVAEIKRREEELSKLSQDLEKRPNLARRRSYIERVNEITKNSGKQDNDIQRILKDTRELQLESNTIQERLNRTYAVVNETIFREAKKDPVARQAYRLLTNIHESFEQIAEKTLATDRTRRDAADYEAKLAIISARSMNTSKLQADLDGIKRENELLEHHQQ
ncbi:hypothetical protein C2S51_013429 [Perilla frutescens var. frutescens]|nr:hypothetical protein C2S51_013429 [Perilla frutescens var. frutescens]